MDAHIRPRAVGLQRPRGNALNVLPRRLGSDTAAGDDPPGARVGAPPGAVDNAGGVGVFSTFMELIFQLYFILVMS